MIDQVSDVRATVPLTDQQQRIVAHSFGPALVYAVAGAGKTTAMVRRVERLVREQVFAPQRVLLSSFNKSAVEDLGRALSVWPHCRQVARSTLHALGYRIVRHASTEGYLPAFARDAVKTNGEERQLLWDAVARVRQRNLAFRDELDALDEQDFLNYVGACKGNLQYPDLAAAQLPAEALKVVREAEAPLELPWYRDLYVLFEEARRERGWLTFDDMLLLGWETLACHPDLLHFWQRSYDAVMVDEFQDVNLAQAELLDLLTREHRNFMAIGDDDQTIYGFRGANVHFFRSFAQRYGATIYEMTDNFRCQGSQVVLANRVIAPSRDRHPKMLVTTRGFAGLTALRRAPDATSMGRQVVGDVRAALDAGFRGAEIAVLVRLTAQTPLIEQPLIEAGIPYRLVGEEPFFRRREIVDLLRYVDLADYDATLRAGQRLDGHAQEDFVAAWQQLYNRPKRYFTRQFCQEIAQSVTRAGRPLSVLLQEAANRGAHRNPDTLRDLADLLRWLAAAGQRLPAADLLRELDQRLGYQDFLIKHSGFASTGAGKAANVVAFIEYAQGKGKLDVLRTHLAELDARRTVIEEGNPDVVELRTIHRAKGLEWPVVLVPNCNPGFFPASAATDIEEERRVLYVALTRAKAQLVLYAVHGGDTVVSPFLIAAQADITLARSAEIAATLASDPLSWTAQQALSLLIFPRQYAQERFFTHWWAVPAELQQRCVSRLLAFVQQLAARDALDTLDVAESDVAFWRSIGPAFLPPDAAPFAKLDALLATRATVQPARHTTSAPYRVGDAVTHPKFGQGVVRQINTVVERGKTDWHLNVDFHSAGRKKLLASLAPLRRVGT